MNYTLRILGSLFVFIIMAFLLGVGVTVIQESPDGFNWSVTFGLVVIIMSYESCGIITWLMGPIYDWVYERFWNEK